MLRIFNIRLFHTCKFCLSEVDKTLLAKLRKSTGYTISNCKKALEVNNNDLSSAEKWIKEMAMKEGWEKAMKLKDRVATQGLIGIHQSDNAASIVEVNCETDFVARNKYFIEMVRNVAVAVHASQMIMQPQTESYSIIKKSVLPSDLPKIQINQMTLADEVAMAISRLGENIILRRATAMIAGDGVCLNAYCHPVPEEKLSTTLYGKHGAIVAYRQNSPVSEMGLQLCRHIIGMNPVTIGNEETKAAENEDEETVMFHQEFLPNPEVTVGEFLMEEGAEVIDFIRFSCGQV